MDISIFLAKVVGLYLVITGFFTFIKYKEFPNIIKSMSLEKGTLFVLAIITLMIGLLLVVSHNIWVLDWRLLITLIAWLILLSGIFRLFFLDYFARVGQWWTKHMSCAITVSVIFFLIGIFLIYKGFFTA
jgi:hypothetical protein